jgi:hypothetical protein
MGRRLWAHKAHHLRVQPGLIEQLPPLFGRYSEDEHGVAHLKWNSGDMMKYETFGEPLGAISGAR